MSVLINNCFHWVGFHLLNKLLENGYRVDGINLSHSKKTEHLSMYTGRNNLFKQIESVKINDAYSVVIINGYDSIDLNKEELEFQKKLLSSYEHDKMKIKELDLPLLYGEWMPMDEEGIFRLNKYIPFDSKKFRNNSIYIKCFTDWIIDLIDKEDLKSSLIIYLKENKSLSEQILENKVGTYDTVYRNSSLESVISHYKKNKIYY